MSTSAMNYDLHGLVTLQAIYNTAHGVSPLADPFPTFQVEALPDIPDITLAFGPFEPKPEDCYLVDHFYYVRRSYLYCKDSWRNFRWQVEIEGFEQGPTTIRLNMRGGGLRSVLLPGFYSGMLLTRQVLARKLHERGCVLAHAAGAVRDGRAVVLFGRGGAYKTSVLMSLLRTGDDWRALGDDGVILKGTQALSFPIYPGLFAYRMAHNENETLHVFDRMRHMLNPSAVENEAGLYADHAETAALVEMRAGGVEAVKIEKVPLAENLTAMQNGMSLEAHNSVNIGFNDIYPRYVEAYSYIFPQNSMQTTREVGVELASIPAYRVTLPSKPGREDLQKAAAFLKNIMGA